MLGLFRVIVWGLIFYIIYKTAVRVMKIFAGERKNESVEEKPNKSKYKIKTDDIIEAKFEDITAADKDKSKQ
jgi:hypothetical protein